MNDERRDRGATDVQLLARDRELIERAVDQKFKSKRNVARFLGVSPQAVSNYGTKNLMPQSTRRLLLIELGLGDELPSGRKGEVSPPGNEPWRDADWRHSVEVIKAHEQVHRIHLRTGGTGSAWTALLTLLDLIEAWSERDWRTLWTEGREWVVAFRSRGSHGGAQEVSSADEDRRL